VAIITRAPRTKSTRRYNRHGPIKQRLREPCFNRLHRTARCPEPPPEKSELQQAPFARLQSSNCRTIGSRRSAERSGSAIGSAQEAGAGRASCRRSRTRSFTPGSGMGRFIRPALGKLVRAAISLRGGFVAGTDDASRCCSIYISPSQASWLAGRSFRGGSRRLDGRDG